MASTGLLAPAALGFRVRGRGQPSFSVSACRVAVLGDSPHQLTLSLSSQSVLWCGQQTAERPDPRVSACYTPGGTIARRRHLGCNTCSLRTWMRAANHHAGHAYSITGRMSCLYSRTPFLTERSLFIFRREPSIPNLWVALFLTWSMWGDQVRQLKPLITINLAMPINSANQLMAE